MRSRADIPSETFVANSTLNTWIDQSIADLHDTILAVNPDYYLSNSLVNIASGTGRYALPSDFYKLRGFDLKESDGNWYETRQFNWESRNARQNATGRMCTRYRVMGGYLELRPKPGWTQTSGGNIWYIPAPSALSADNSTYDGIAGWEEAVILDVCIKCAAKEESDASTFMAQKSAVIDRIRHLALHRTESDPDRVRDVSAENDSYFYTSLWRP